MTSAFSALAFCPFCPGTSPEGAFPLGGLPPPKVSPSGKLLPLSGETLTERKQTAPADAESLTAVEYRDRLYDLADRFAVLDIPMLIDRSADEADALAQADWLRLYGVLFGNETTAERMIREITSREG